MIKITRQLCKAFLANIKFTDSSCWLWKGPRIGKNYGSFTWEGVQYRAHRLAITLFLDPNYNPDGRGWDGDYATHDCDVKLCVSPHCLRIGDATSNNREAIARGLIDLTKRSKIMLGNKINLGRKASKATRRKISKLLLGNQRRLGHNHSKVSRRRMSESHKGHSVSKATKRKISMAQKRRWARRTKVYDQIQSS
jgi:hypothetical protein